MKNLIVIVSLFVSLLAQAQENQTKMQGAAAIYMAAPNEIIFRCTAANDPFQISFRLNGTQFLTEYNVHDGCRLQIPAQTQTVELWNVKSSTGSPVAIDPLHGGVCGIEDISQIELIFDLPAQTEQPLVLTNYLRTIPSIDQFWGASVSFEGPGVSGIFFDPRGLSGDVRVIARFEWANSILTYTRYIFVPGCGFEDEYQVQVKVYPNPASDKLTIEAEQALGTLEIYNLMGVLLYSKKDCDSKVEINVSTLPNGVYFVRTQQFRKKFVKQ